MSQNADLSLIFSLLSRSSSLSVVSDFLKSRGLTHSAGSWDEMLERRLRPALNEHQISIIDVLDLLRSAEEFGRQHTFLFRGDAEPTLRTMDRPRIGRLLSKLGLEGLLEMPRTFELPEHPSIVDVRWSTSDVDVELVIKEVETKESNEYRETKVHGNQIAKLYELVTERAVNVVRLHRNGDLEVRLQSRRGSSRYEEDLHKFANRIKPFVDLNEFAIVPLAKAKARLWNDRVTLAEKIRYSDVTVKNDDDISLRASAGTMTNNVAENEAAANSVNSFLSSDGYCDSSNLWFVKREAVPKRDVHVVIGGMSNEFAVPTNCSEADYEYVLSEIRTLNG